MTAAAVALTIEASKRLRTGDSFENEKMKKGKSENEKLNERNIFLSRDSCSCRVKRLRTGDLFEASKRLSTGDSLEKEKMKIGKIKLNERNIFLSRDSCSCRANEKCKRGSLLGIRSILVN